MKRQFYYIGKVTLLSCGLSAPAFGAEHTVTQKDKMFDKSEMTIKAGDTINVVNSDPTTHHLMLTLNGEKFSEKQASGSDPVKLKFTEAQETTIRCAIHPKMKLNVKVTP